MRIVLVCKTYPTIRPGGMPFVCEDRAHALAAMGHEVHVMTTSMYDKYANGCDMDGNPAVHYTASLPSTYSKEFADSCLRRCLAIMPDVIHLDSFNPTWPWWLDLPEQITTGLTFHGFGWGAWLTRLNLYYRGEKPPSGPAPDMLDVERERNAAMKFDRVIGISRHEHWLLQQMMAMYDAKLVYNPIAPYFFQGRLTPAPNTKRFLCAAVSGHRERGFDIAKRAAEKAGAEVLMVSKAPRCKMPAIIDGCDGLILPTAYAQGLDLAVGESLARLRPVIATATGSYLREAERGGAYEGSLRLVHLIDPDGDRLAEALRFPPVMSNHNAADVHKPEYHAVRWLEVMQ